MRFVTITGRPYRVVASARRPIVLTVLRDRSGGRAAGVRREWELEELIAARTLLAGDWEPVGNKTGATRLAFSLIGWNATDDAHAAIGSVPANHENVPLTYSALRAPGWGTRARFRVRVRSAPTWCSRSTAARPWFTLAGARPPSPSSGRRHALSAPAARVARTRRHEGDIVV
ncbi:hypothetical protein GCM10023191_072700 [Actinoallomurus oryzae]|uniref:Uncharacterized protein n=1 Tax=Actinoallomurus oryzae TaxID=502180 RepID=A0ABP8QTD8_9ACTN